MIRLRELTAALAAALILSGAADAKTPEEVRAACRAEGRPCVGLVLSGGGARGFAHAGVLKVLETLGVRIDVVTGTSMGSMVGGAYAAGYTAEEIERIVLSVDWDQMLAVRPERELLPWRRKAEDFQGLSSAAIEITADGRARLPKAIVPSQELDIFLMRHTGIVSMVEDLSYLSIPFAASATDLITGERIVMQKNCTLGTAMRASMSVPGAFAPLNVGDHMLVDGGLVDNLPVELAREMGADVIIAVNVGTPLDPLARRPGHPHHAGSDRALQHGLQKERRHHPRRGDRRADPRRSVGAPRAPARRVGGLGRRAPKPHHRGTETHRARHQRDAR